MDGKANERAVGEQSTRGWKRRRRRSRRGTRGGRKEGGEGGCVERLDEGRTKSKEEKNLALLFASDLLLSLLLISELSLFQRVKLTE